TNGGATNEHPPIPWRAVLSHPHVWLLGGVLACAAFNTYLYFSWYPTYLEKGRGVDSIESGRLASLVLTGGAIGCIGGGVLIDWLIRRTGNRRLSRRAWCSFAFAVAAACLDIGRSCDSPRFAALWTAGSVMFSVSTLSAWWGAVTDISGRHLGALCGLMYSLGGLGAIASQLFVGRFADWMKARGHTGRAQWDPMFSVYAVVLLVAACGWLFIDSRRSIEEPAEG
ncbi:MAG TPA: MFS transporter, partial [Planctomycetaceae bacterium]|nr:MFS transporter [Planctomycetaceae bacterium]